MTKIFLYTLLFFLAACNTENIKDAGYDPRDIRQAIDDHKIKRVKESHLIAWLQVQSPRIDSLLERALSQCPEKDLSCLQSPALGQLLDSLRGHYQALIEPLPFQNLQTSNFKGKEATLLEAYLYQWQQQAPLSSNLQKISADTFLYTSPLRLADKDLGLWRMRFTKTEMIRKINPKFLYQQP
jgi:hypothetical protein